MFEELEKVIKSSERSVNYKSQERKHENIAWWALDDPPTQLARRKQPDLEDRKSDH